MITFVRFKHKIERDHIYIIKAHLRLSVCLSVSYLLLNRWADLKNIWHAYSPHPWECFKKIIFLIGQKNC